MTTYYSAAGHSDPRSRRWKAEWPNLFMRLSGIVQTLSYKINWLSGCWKGEHSTIIIIIFFFFVLVLKLPHYIFLCLWLARLRCLFNICFLSTLSWVSTVFCILKSSFTKCALLFLTENLSFMVIQIVDVLEIIVLNLKLIIILILAVCFTIFFFLGRKV